MIESILLLPFFAIILMAISCSLNGVFILYKRLAYFGDALSHAILLGLALSVIFSLNQNITLIIFALFFAIACIVISKNEIFSKDAIIMILAYSSVSMAILLNDIFGENLRFSSFIFGDILTVSNFDIYLILALTLANIIYFSLNFKKLLLISISEDLAKIENIKVSLIKTSFLMLLALNIAIFIKISGIFLMSALLILPAAIARIFSSSPLQMVIIAILSSLLSAIFAFYIALDFNLTVSSTIIAIFAVIFLISVIFKKSK